MRVCMLVLNTLNPDPRVWRECGTLARQGLDVSVLAMRKQGQRKEEWVDGFRVLRHFSTYPFKFNHLHRMLTTWWEFFLFLMDRNRMPFDVCHCHDPDTLLFGYLLSKKDGAKLIYDSHEFFLDFMPFRGQGLFGLMKKLGHWITRVLPERVFISRCSHVITVNASISRLIKAAYGLKERPVYLLNTLAAANGIQARFKSRSGAGGEKVIVFQGAISWDRQIERIIEIIADFDNRFVLKLLGSVSPGYRKELSDFAKEKGVYNRIEFGEVPYKDLLRETAKGDAGVCLIEPLTLSYKYSLPNKFFEYIFAEIPVIVSNLPEMRKIVRKYGIGEVVDLRNKGETIRLIRNILSNSDHDNKELKERIRESKKRLCWENEEKKLIEIYRRLGMTGA